MADPPPPGRIKRHCELLLDLVENYNPFHVGTFRYNDLQGILSVVSETGRSRFVPVPSCDTVAELERYIREDDRSDVQLLAVQEIAVQKEVQISKQTKYLLVYINAPSSKYNSVVVFLMTNPKRTAPYSKKVSDLLDNTNRLIKSKSLRGAFLPTFASQPSHQIHPRPQGSHPILHVHQPQSYSLPAKQRKGSGSLDSFHREYVEVAESEATVNPWSVYSGLPSNLQCSIDVQQSMQDPSMLLGRGGFGIVVETSAVQVAKVNMFPEMADWSLPFIEDQFYRYAHIATQVEEIAIGVSMKHPNILRTFGGYWCDIPQYPLGGRGVIVMEKALFSLQEFMAKMNKLHAPESSASIDNPGDSGRHTALLPIVELDTLRGLEYLHARHVQHRDLTYRNILVCHQPDRKPVELSFKLSDFGTACNYSTPDQQRGNRVHTAPEVLWCLNSTTASDVFSWYCVMWELYTGSPLIEYRSAQTQSEFCKKTYGDSLSKLVGVYTPANPTTAFLSNYMKSYDAETLYGKYGHSRPTAAAIGSTLGEMGRNIRDKAFVNMGVLCITLFPQERSTPSDLLRLNRYTYLNRDVSHTTAPAHMIPSTVRVGQYRATDVIVANDCVPGQLRKLAQDKKLGVYTHTSKRYYGIDLLRLSPDLQPDAWYTEKETELSDRVRKACSEKRRAGEPLECTLETLCAADSDRVGAFFPCAKRTQPEVQPGAVPGMHNVTADAALSGQQPSDKAGRRAPTGVVTAEDTLTRAPSVPQVPAAYNVAAAGNHQSRTQQGQTTRPSLSQPSRVKCLVRTKKTKGESDVTMVIVTNPTEDDVACFERDVVERACRLTKEHPLLFAGPRKSVYKQAKAHGLYVFQYGQFFRSTKMINWVLQRGESFYPCLMQVLLTLKAAAENNVLPTNMATEHLLLGRGAVMIDIVGYLSAHFPQPDHQQLLGTQSPRVASVCLELLSKHQPGSPLVPFLERCQSSFSHCHDIERLVAELSRLDVTSAIARVQPVVSSLAHTHFTFREYLADVPNWVGSRVGEANLDKCTAKVLVCGNPTRLPFTRFSKTECRPDSSPGAADVTPDHGGLVKDLVRNIVLRLKAKALRGSAIAVTTLDCTQGLTKITLRASALSGIPSVDELKGHMFESLDELRLYTHDVAALLDWAPVMKITKHVTSTPLSNFSSYHYKIIILLVRIDAKETNKGAIKTLDELFRGVPLYCTTDY
ncbi:carboxyl-terminal PDZ ligand of neuronal nitric oxide synthase protein [Sarotherodon galilaeus]